MKKVKIDAKIVFNVDEQGKVNGVSDVKSVKVCIDRFKQITNISKLCFLISLIIYAVVFISDFNKEFINPIWHVICVAVSLAFCIRAFVTPCQYYGDEDE